MAKVLNIMIEVGADLNYHNVDEDYGSDPKPWRNRIIDVVARRGDLMLMQRLLGANARHTSHTLTCAVDSGNEDLVLFLMNGVANINDWPYDWPYDRPYPIDCPLASAIRLQQESMVELVLDHTDPNALSMPQVFRSTWQAAVEVGSTKWIRKLLNVCAGVNPLNLGSALDTVTANSMREVDFELIDAGAVTSYLLGDSMEDPPALLSALKQQDSALVYTLLEKDTLVYHSKNASDLLDIAMSWET